MPTQQHNECFNERPQVTIELSFVINTPVGGRDNHNSRAADLAQQRECIERLNAR